jgi:hypothetical protein
MYIGNSYTAWFKYPITVEHQCSMCRNTAQFRVVGLGMGKGASPYFLNETGAENKAEERAQKAAKKNAFATAKLIKCPACGNRDAKEVRNFWLLQLAKIVGGAAFFLLLGVILFQITEDEVIYYFMLGAWILYVPILFFTDIKWRWFTIDQRTEIVKKSAGDLAH